MSSTPTETEQTDLPPRARVQRELLRLNQTVFAIEQALAEIGELNDHETRAVLVSAEATRGRLVAVMDAVTATNPVGAQSFEHRMQEARPDDRTPDEVAAEHDAREHGAQRGDQGAAEGHPDERAPAGDDRRGQEHTTREGNDDAVH